MWHDIPTLLRICNQKSECRFPEIVAFGPESGALDGLHGGPTGDPQSGVTLHISPCQANAIASLLELLQQHRLQV